MSKEWVDILKAINHTYDNTESELSSDNVQDAIDEIYSKGPKVFYQVDEPTDYNIGDTWVPDITNETDVTPQLFIASDVRDEFIFVMRTTTENETITLPATGTNNFEIDWGDGNAETVTTASPTHEYATADDHTITITGTCPVFSFNNAGDKDKLIQVHNLGEVGWTTLDNSFYGCTNADALLIGKTDTSLVTDFDGAFRQLDSMQDIDVSELQTGSGVHFRAIFAALPAIAPPDVSSWDVSKGELFSSFFYDMRSVTSPPNVSAWDMSNAINIDAMFTNFYACLTPPDVSQWDVRKVTTFYLMFGDMRSITVPPDVSSWETDSVITLQSTFQGFHSVESAPDVSGWNTSGVTTMQSMCRTWNPAIEFDMDIDVWDIEACSNMTNMLQNTTLTTECYDRTLNAWAAQTVQPDVVAHFGNSKYSTASAAARDILTINNNWTITDGGPA